MSNFYNKPRGHVSPNTSAPHNPIKGRKHLRRAFAKLERRRREFSPESPGGHQQRRPGSMK